MGNLIAEVDLEGREVSEVVQEWLDANPDVWKPWTACAG
jgi:ABC-type proline/glycine betaine transport system substrate-binding protein